MILTFLVREAEAKFPCDAPQLTPVFCGHTHSHASKWRSLYLPLGTFLGAITEVSEKGPLGRTGLPTLQETREIFLILTLCLIATHFLV